MSKRKLQQLRAALINIDRAIAWIEQDKVVLTCRTRLTGASVYTNPGGDAIHELTKFVGSELYTLKTGRGQLADFIKVEALKGTPEVTS